jgi:predicted RecA/RadA family phage recombinase
MPDLLLDKLVLLYFQPDASAARANADLVVIGQQEKIASGERVLEVDSGGVVSEAIAQGEFVTGYHPGTLRLPSKYQTDKVMVTCPVCKFTYEHQHVFAEGTK